MLHINDPVGPIVYWDQGTRCCVLAGWKRCVVAIVLVVAVQATNMCSVIQLRLRTGMRCFTRPCTRLQCVCVYVCVCVLSSRDMVCVACVDRRLPVALLSVSNVIRDILHAHFNRIAPVVPNAIDADEWVILPRPNTHTRTQTYTHSITFLRLL
jgi:hypothetical protein